MLTVSVNKREPDTPLYNIGVMSRLCGLPIHTLRWIEQHGLISPFRTDGHQRLFSELDLQLIQEIRDLMEQDVNLPGIRIILQMRAGKPGDSRPVKKGKGRAKRTSSPKA